MHLNEFERHVVDHLLKTSAPGKHACRSAIRHLERGWMLSTSMPELAFFSGITAEEESATALFHVLQKRRYIGAENLKVRTHIHKTALHPFLAAVGKLITQHSDALNPEFIFDVDSSSKGKERLQLAINVPDHEGGIVRAYSLPPLSFTVPIDDVVHDFANELENLASENGAKQIFELIKNRANLRNQLLYAGPNGVPNIKDDAMPFLIDCKSIVFSHFIAFLLIDPYREHQSFVQQSLNAFLKILNRAPQNEFET